MFSFVCGLDDIKFFYSVQCLEHICLICAVYFQLLNWHFLVDLATQSNLEHQHLQFQAQWFLYPFFFLGLFFRHCKRFRITSTDFSLGQFWPIAFLSDSYNPDFSVCPQLFHDIGLVFVYFVELFCNIFNFICHLKDIDYHEHGDKLFSAINFNKSNTKKMKQLLKYSHCCWGSILLFVSFLHLAHRSYWNTPHLFNEMLELKSC